jgi:hypothetical protein
VNFFYLAAVALLLLLLFWALRAPGKQARGAKDENALLGQAGRRHTTYLPLIRQALSPGDLAFVASRGFTKLYQRIQKERRGVALSYLTALHQDFTRLLDLATVVAALSPEVAPTQEKERVWLKVQFTWRYQLLRVALHAGVFPQHGLDLLSHQVSELAIRMETAIRELGERAAVVAKLASSLDGRGVDAV